MLYITLIEFAVIALIGYFATNAIGMAVACYTPTIGSIILQAIVGFFLLGIIYKITSKKRLTEAVDQMPAFLSHKQKVISLTVGIVVTIFLCLNLFESNIRYLYNPALCKGL